jgi:CheY-like chemotaxis protein
MALLSVFGGIVITEENEFLCASIGSELYHLATPETIRCHLYDLSSCYLNIMSQGQAALDENSSLKIELARSRIIQKQTRESYNINVERLGKKVEDLRNEIILRKESEKKYRDIFDNALEGIFQSTPEGRIITANPSLVKMFGYANPEEIVTILKIFGHHVVDSVKKIAQQNTKAGLEGFRILIAEDNPTIQEVTAAVLESAGVSYRIARNGHEAIEIIRNEPFDAVLMDCQMPEMNGYQTTKAIREWERNIQKEKTPIIAVTANAMKGDADKCREAGMDSYLSKPITREHLFRTLLKHLKNKKPLENHVETIKEKNIRADTDYSFLLPQINLKAVKDALKIDNTILLKILVNFKNRNLSTLLNMKTAYQEGKWNDLKSIAHALKGASGNIGAVYLQEAAGNETNLW